jgi:phage head maturation protease
MAFSNYRGFGSILKSEEQSDGTIKVYGIASTGARDHAGEIVTPDAMKAALPDYAKYPALREMHQASAAGRVTDAYVDDDGATQIEAHVVDPIAITKVKTGVYGGFSIGGKVTKRDPEDRTIITGIRLAEISLVDSPANPEATLNMWKADMSDYNPSGDEVVAKAKEMAKEAGRKNFKDYLYFAREELIAIAKAEASEALTDAEPEPVAKADEAAPEVIDPAAALADALAKAQELTAEPEAPAHPLANLKKSAAFLSLLAKRAETDLAKGLYTVARFAQVIDAVADIQASTAYESQHEGDNSPVPAELAAAVAALCTTLVHMVAEETSEIVAQYAAQGMDIDFDPTASDDDDGDDDFAYAASVIDLVKADTDLMEKAGSRHNKTDATLVQEVHDKAVALGACCNEAEPEHQGAEEDHAKAHLIAENERLSKALADAAPQVEELAKAFGDKFASMTATIDSLTKRLETVEATPAAAKTAASALRTITKGEDISPATADAHAGTAALSADEFRKHMDALPEKERGELLLRVALSNPQIISAARTAA